MKKLNYLWILISIIACNSNIKDKERKDDIVIDKKTAINNQVPNQGKDSSVLYPLNGKLPFGSVYLENLDTSYGWDSPKWKNVDDLNLKIYRYYESINYLKIIPKPEILEIDSIKLKYSKHFIDSLTNLSNYIRYKFENIGPYECYYSQITENLTTTYPPNFDYDKRRIETSGNLILYNAVSKTAKIINIHSIISEPYDGEESFFFIGKDKIIKIYHFEGDDGGITNFYQIYSITVLDNGEIKINKLKPRI